LLHHRGHFFAGMAWRIAQARKYELFGQDGTRPSVQANGLSIFHSQSACLLFGEHRNKAASFQLPERGRVPSVLSPPQALNRSPHASAYGLQHPSAAPTDPAGGRSPSGLALVPLSSAAPRELGEQERGSCPPLRFGSRGVTTEPGIEGRDDGRLEDGRCGFLG
jgi:hypothetical protein